MTDHNRITAKLFFLTAAQLDPPRRGLVKRKQRVDEAQQRQVVFHGVVERVRRRGRERAALVRRLDDARIEAPRDAPRRARRGLDGDDGDGPAPSFFRAAVSIRFRGVGRL